MAKNDDKINIINRLDILEGRLEEMHKVLDNKLTAMNSFYAAIMSKQINSDKAEKINDEQELPKKKIKCKRQAVLST